MRRQRIQTFGSAVSNEGQHIFCLCNHLFICKSQLSLFTKISLHPFSLWRCIFSFYLSKKMGQRLSFKKKPDSILIFCFAQLIFQSIFSQYYKLMATIVGCHGQRSQRTTKNICIYKGFHKQPLTTSQACYQERITMMLQQLHWLQVNS